MSEPQRGIMLPTGETGSAFFHRLLASAVERFPATLGGVGFPRDASIFKRDYAEALVAFEGARAAATDRVDIALHLTRGLHAGLTFASDGGTVPLAEHLADGLAGARAPAMQTLTGQGRPGLTPRVEHEGGVYERRSVMALADDLHRQHHMSDAAHAGLRWIIERAEADGGTLDLRDHSFALLGAAAELAPTMMLLRAGATVLWIDRVAPADRLTPAELASVAGQIVVPSGVGDVLADPRAVQAAITHFAAMVEQPVHIGLFAYAPGKGRELRLGAGMDAIVRSLDPTIVRSVAMFVSPTIAGEVQPEDLAYIAERVAHPVAWQRALERVRVLSGPGYHAGAAPIAKAIVSLQGATYQAAQYLAKMATAEVYATQGVALDDPPRPLVVSANVAGIAATRSLTHPLFQAGFLGAPSFGVRIFEPSSTRALASLLVLHDLLNPASASSPEAHFDTPTARAKALAARQLHGGVFNLPWVFDKTIRASAALGLARRPSLVLALARLARPRRVKST